MPWTVSTPGRMEKYHLLENYCRNRRHGLKKQFCNYPFGPVTPEFITVKIDTLRSLIASIRNQGYHRHDGPDGDIKGVFLHDDVSCGSNWRVRLDCGGNHRAAILAAMGYNCIPIRIYPQDLIRRSELPQWHLVRTGILSSAQAKAVWWRIFNADPPEDSRQESKPVNKSNQNQKEKCRWP